MTHSRARWGRRRPGFPDGGIRGALRALLPRGNGTLTGRDVDDMTSTSLRRFGALSVTSRQP